MSIKKTDMLLAQEELDRMNRKLPEAPFPDGLCGGRLVTLEDIPVQKSSSFWSNEFFFPARTVQVWLPPQYFLPENNAFLFSVLYCHDGQNAMQDSSSWTGSSWRMAGALTRLAERNLFSKSVIHPPIVVMIPSTEGDLLGFRRRHLEYGDASQQLAQMHADHVALTIKSIVDSRFRTNQNENYAIGSSLGGQAALHLLMRHENLFNGAACLSPAFSAGTLASVVTASSALKDKRIYIDNGGDDDEIKVPFFDLFDHVTTEHWWNPGYWWLDTQLQPGVDAMKMALDLRGIPYRYQKIPGARHNERAWAQRIHHPLIHLFGDNEEIDQ